MTAPSTSTDVVVIGAGPAAWSAAAAIADVGLGVALVAPAPSAPWPATYGVWVDELDGLGLGKPFRARAEQVVVVGEERHVLDRPYAVLDNEALAQRLARPVHDGGHAVVDGCVVGANHDRWRSTVVLADGRTVTGRVVVDASGATPILVQRPERPRPAHQVARGIIARFNGDVTAPDTATLMDLSSPSNPSSPGAGEEDPTFLYALDLGNGSTLVEETSLARRNPLAVDILDRRLTERLARLGVEPVEVVGTEAVDIAMGAALPSLAQREVGFGAAASMVHPATGYSVAASLRAAPRLAGALADALDGRRATPASASRAGWDAVWPLVRRRAWRLERFGLDALLRLDGTGQRQFFDAFFTLEPPLWAGYLSSTLAPAEITALMGELFTRVPWSVRATLLRANPLGLLAPR